MKDKEVEQTLRSMTDFVLQFDEETQELWMRLFELLTKQVLIEEETKLQIKEHQRKLWSLHRAIKVFEKNVERGSRGLGNQSGKGCVVE